VDVRNAVDDSLAEVDPDREMAGEVALRPARSSEVEDLLSRRMHTVTDHFGEEPAEPGTTREHIDVRFDLRTVIEPE